MRTCAPSCEAAFADLSKGTEKVTFTPDRGAEGARRQRAGGHDRAARPWCMSTIKHYIDAAGIGPMAGTAIVGEDKYDPATLISQLTLQLPEGNGAGGWSSA